MKEWDRHLLLVKKAKYLYSWFAPKFFRTFIGWSRSNKKLFLRCRRCLMINRSFKWSSGFSFLLKLLGSYGSVLFSSDFIANLLCQFENFCIPRKLSLGVHLTAASWTFNGTFVTKNQSTFDAQPHPNREWLVWQVSNNSQSRKSQSLIIFMSKGYVIFLL